MLNRVMKLVYIKGVFFMDVVSINVGDRVPQAFLTPEIKEGCQLYLSSAGRAVLCLFIDGMTEEEVHDLASYPVETASLAVKGYWLGVLRIGDAIYELPFDPVEHSKTYGDFSPELFNEKSTVYLLAADIKNETIRVLRLLRYPKDFMESIGKALAGASLDDHYTENYNAIREVLSSYPLWQLWAEAEKTGEFQEVEM